jgi:peptidyl-prolyl cis-trans isomerase B (cyclophilin B)
MFPRVARFAPLLVVAGVIAGCGGGNGDDEKSAQLPPGCEQVEAPAPKRVDLERPKRLRPPPEGTVATVATSCGAFEIELDSRRSPHTTASFAQLVDEGVYDGTVFHRIVPDFVIQGGDPRGDGTGGPGYFVDEPPPADTEYTRRTVAMAKTEVEPPGRSGSQFFVVAGADAGLPPDYALLGKVSGGFGVVRRIAELGDPASGQTGTPLAPVVIDSITLG